MPTTRDFKAKPSKTKKAKPIGDAMSENSPAMSMSSGKRRPAREIQTEILEQSAKTESAMQEPTMKTEEQVSPDKSIPTTEELVNEFEARPEEPKVEIHFKGSELLRARFPKPFLVAEAVATGWVNGGKFEDLPIAHPLTNWATQQGLLKAKELEKKVMESPAVEKAAMQALTLGMKAQGLVEQVRERLKRS